MEYFNFSEENNKNLIRNQAKDIEILLKQQTQTINHLRWNIFLLAVGLLIAFSVLILQKEHLEYLEQSIALLNDNIESLELDLLDLQLLEEPVPVVQKTPSSFFNTIKSMFHKL